MRVLEFIADHIFSRSEHTLPSTVSGKQDALSVLKGNENLYALLGTNPSASEEELRQAFIARAKTFHPDLNQEDAASEEAFKHVAQAYKILSEPTLRSRYDQLLKRRDKASKHTDKPGAFWLMPMAGVAALLALFVAATYWHWFYVVDVNAARQAKDSLMSQTTTIANKSKAANQPLPQTTKKSAKETLEQFAQRIRRGNYKNDAERKAYKILVLPAEPSLADTKAVRAVDQVAEPLRPDDADKVETQADQVATVIAVAEPEIQPNSKAEKASSAAPNDVTASIPQKAPSVTQSAKALEVETTQEIVARNPLPTEDQTAERFEVASLARPLIAREIQDELERHNCLARNSTGVWGEETKTAARAWLHRAGLNSLTFAEPNESLLKALKTVSARCSNPLPRRASAEMTTAQREHQTNAAAPAPRTNASAAARPKPKKKPSSQIGFGGIGF